MLTTVVRHMTDMMSLPGEKFDNLNTSLKNYNDFLTKINDVDLTKLKTTVKLFEQMVNFSKSINGNFEDLADSLNEKIAPLLEELKESLTAVQQHVSEKPSTDMEAEKRSIFSNFKQNGQTQNLTQSQIETKVEDKYKDNIQQRYGIDEILSKISTLTDLFQNGDARVKTT
jgi:dGTP triphosphohydrolase